MKQNLTAVNLILEDLLRAHLQVSLLRVSVFIMGLTVSGY